MRSAAAAPGRIAGLSVVAAAVDAAWAVRVARMCEVARIDALWLRVGAAGTDPDAVAVLRAVAEATTTLAVGFTPATRDDAVAVRARIGQPRVRDRLELCAAGPSDLRDIRSGADPAGAPTRLSVYIADGAEAATVADLADAVVVRSTPSRAALVATVHDVRDRLRAADGRSPTIGIAAEVPVSIGRTVAEAEARAMRAGDAVVRDAGLFGTLEQCQTQAHELVHAGATELRCIVPTAPDVDDVIAQLTAVAIGDAATFRPGRPRSPDPLPPAGWGGPPSRPVPAPDATDDVRRR